MCKLGTNLVAVNKVMLGARVIGIECWNMDKQEVTGLTEKALKDALVDGAKVYGYELSEDGKELRIAKDFTIVLKTGIATYQVEQVTDGLLNETLSLIDHTAEGAYEFITPRFGRKVLTESKVRALLEISAGSLNGIKLEGDKLVTWFDEQEATPVKVEQEQEAPKKK